MFYSIHIGYNNYYRESSGYDGLDIRCLMFTTLAHIKTETRVFRFIAVSIVITYEYVSM